MKRFAFRLEGVLRYRKEVEQQRQALLARSLEAVEARREEARRVRDQVEEAVEEMRRLGRRNLDLSLLRQQSLRLATLRGLLSRLETGLREAEAEEERARGEYMEARKERQALELLRSQRLSEHARREGVEEQKELDEIGTRLAGGSDEGGE